MVARRDRNRGAGAQCVWGCGPAESDWRDKWREPLCARCSAHLITRMQEPPPPEIVSRRNRPEDRN